MMIGFNIDKAELLRVYCGDATKVQRNSPASWILYRGKMALHELIEPGEDSFEPHNVGSVILAVRLIRLIESKQLSEAHNFEWNAREWTDFRPDEDCYSANEASDESEDCRSGSD